MRILRVLRSGAAARSRRAPGRPELSANDASATSPSGHAPARIRRFRPAIERRPVPIVPHLALLALSTCATSGLQAAEATADTDGIVAEMRVAADGLKIDWRFLRAPPAPIASLSVTGDGRPLSEPDGPVAAFPAPGQTAVIQMLSNPGDRSAPQFAAADLASDLPAGVTVRAASFDPKPDEARADGLAAAIDRSLDDLGAETADRRALLLAAAGPGLASGPVLEAAARARRQDIPIFVVLGASASDVDRESAARFAQAARGTLLDGRGSLASRVADTVLSGAELSFPLQVQPYLPWQNQAVTLRASLVYGERHLDMSAVVGRPPADRGQTATAVWNTARPLVPSFLAGVVLAVLVGWAVRARAVPTRRGRA